MAKLIKLDRWALLFVGGKDTNGQPKSCFNCPHLLATQETCEYMDSDIIIRRITVDNELYTPVCGYQIGGLPTVTDNPVYLGKDPDELGLEWAKGTGTNCDGFADGAPCEHFVPTEGEDGICDAMKEDDNEVDWDDCCAAHDGEFMPWGDAQELIEPAVAKLAKERRMKTTFKKFIPFAKVDAVKREVWGVVTAELPDKEDEVCDYAGSKPFYEALIAEVSKATDGKNLFPLREMHQLSAVGKGIGFDFRDADKEIFMGFKVVDDVAWNKVDEGVYTGFSHGGVKVGDSTPDPVFKGCTRYVANPSEVSLVDNPCLGAAHFAYVKADGSVELRKLRSEPHGEAFVSLARFSKMSKDVEELKTKMNGSTTVAKKTKRVAGEDLPSSAFLIVGDKEKTETWKLPIKFSSDAKTKRHIRNAIARFDQVKDVSQADKDAAWKRLVAAAKQYDIEVADEKTKLASIHDWLRKGVRTRVNRSARKAALSHSLTFIDDDLGRLTKGLYDVGRLACCIQELGWMLYGVISEQEWEQDDDSVVPDMLAANVNSLLDTLVAYAAEEVQEFREEISTRMS